MLRSARVFQLHCIWYVLKALRLAAPLGQLENVSASESSLHSAGRVMLVVGLSYVLVS